jgi:hypothetical protein
VHIAMCCLRAFGGRKRECRLTLHRTRTVQKSSSVPGSYMHLVKERADRRGNLHGHSCSLGHGYVYWRDATCWLDTVTIMDPDYQRGVTFFSCHTGSHP